MRVRYPGPRKALVIDGVEIKRGEEAELTAAQLKRAEAYGVERVETEAKEQTKSEESGG